MNTDGGRLARFVSLHAYQEARSNVFQTFPSPDWYLRAHRKELILAGVLVKVGGGRKLDGPAMDEFVEAQARASMQNELAA